MSLEKAIRGRIHQLAAAIVAKRTSLNMSCSEAMSSHRATEFTLMSVVELQNISRLSCTLIAPRLYKVRFFSAGKIQQIEGQEQLLMKETD